MNQAKKILSILCSFVLIYSIFLPALQVFAEEMATTNEGGKKEFKDIEEHWAKASIEELIDLGIINGYEDGTFRPENDVTRAQFVVMTTRLLGIQSDKSVISFEDVPLNHWAYSSIQAALDQNMIDQSEKFSPETAITREEMAVMIARALELQPINIDQMHFKDKKNIKKQPDLVAAAVQAGLIKGHKDQTFAPQNKLTRGQASVMLVRMAEYLDGVFFKDLENYWAKGAIHSLVNMGVIQGYEDSTFRPENKVTRVQFIAMLIRMMGYENQNVSPVFDDVKSDHWAFDVVQAAVENGIIVPEEYKNKKLLPNQQLTRQEMALMMARTLHLAPSDEALLTFKDKNNITSEAGLIATTVKEGLITGHEDNTFRPSNPSSRGQAATILYRLYNYSMKSEDPNVPTPFPARDGEDEIILLDSVKELPEKVMELLEEVTEDQSTFIFSGDAEEVKGLQEGDIFVLPPTFEYPTGFAEKVISVSNSNGRTNIKTEDPEISEIFKEISVQEVTDVTFDNLIPIEIPEGISFEPYEEDKENNGNFQAASQNQFVAAAKKGDFVLKTKDPIEFKVKGHTVKVSGDITFTETKLSTNVQYFITEGFDDVYTHIQMNPQLTVKVELPKTIASAKGEWKASQVYKGMNFSVKAPSFLNTLDSTEPFERRKSIGTFFLPVYGPVGANFEAFLVLKADLTVGIELKFVGKVKVNAGLNQGMDPYGKFVPLKPTVTVKGQGGIQSEAGFGVGIKLALHGKSIAGIEFEGGLRGEAYARAIAGYGETEDVKAEDKKFQLDSCYRIGLNHYASLQFTLDLVRKIPNLKDQWKLIDDYNKPIAEITNCNENQLIASPYLILLAPGESEKIDLGYYTFNKIELDLQEKTKDMKKEDITYNLKADDGIEVTQNSSAGKHSIDVKIDPKATGGESGELEIIYKNGSKEVKEKVHIIVASFEDIDVEPNFLVLDANESETLNTMAIFKKVEGLDLDEILKKEGMTEDDLFKQEIEDKENIKFKSLDNDVATVSADGVVKGKSLTQGGKTVIEVSYKGKKEVVSVQVRPKAFSESHRDSGSSYDPYLEMFRDIILESEHYANTAFKPEAESISPANFEDLEPMLVDYYTQNYLEKHWKKVYFNNMKWFQDPHLLYPLTEATEKGLGNTFTLKNHTSDTVTATVSVPLRDNEIKGDNLKYEYTLRHENERWRLHDMDCLGCERPE